MSDTAGTGPDTVAASAVTALLGGGRPSFVAGPSAGTPPVATLDFAHAVHVTGGAHVADLVSGFGSPLFVDFVNYGPVANPEPPATIGGQSMAPTSDAQGHVVVGSVFDQLLK